MNIIGEIQFNNEVENFVASLELDGAVDVVTQEINGTQFVYVSAENDAGIQVLSIAADGTLTTVMEVSDNASLGLSNVYRLQAIQVGSEFFLAALSTSEDSITMFRIDDDGVGTDGHLVFVETYFNSPGTGQPTDGQGLLNFAFHSDQITIGNKVFLAVTAYFSNAVSNYEVNGDGTLTIVDSATDSDGQDLNLAGIQNLAFASVGGNNFLVTSSDSNDSGLSVFSIDNNGLLTNVSNFDFSFNSIENLVFKEFNGKSLLFAYNQSTDRIDVFELSSTGDLTLLTSSDFQFFDLEFFNSFEVSGVPFLIATDENGDSVTVMSIDESDELQIVQTFTSSDTLNGAVGVTVQQIGDRVFLLVANRVGDSISVFDIGLGDDPVIGTTEGDRLVGLNGEDDLVGRFGADELFGLGDDDVLSGGKGADTLYGGDGFDALIGGQGDDVLEGGADADFINGGSGYDILSYEFASSAVTIDLSTRGAERGDAEGDLYIGIEGVTGSRFRDILSGDDGANLISGLAGRDLLNGGDGRDTIHGGDSRDTLNGGEGRDRLEGGRGPDEMNGGDGNDRLIGGKDDDILNGDAGADRLEGGRGNDLVNGGTDDDLLIGGSGSDTFVFVDGDGTDTIDDFDVSVDVIDLSGVASITNLSQLNAAAITIGSNTLILIDGGVGSITLNNVVEGDLDASNFIFV